MVGMDNQLRLYACMLAPAPPLAGLILSSLVEDLEKEWSPKRD